MNRPSMNVAALLYVRLASVRCPNKGLRTFGPSNLTRLALERLCRSQVAGTVYFAAYEEELLEQARGLPRVKLIQRSRESAYGEDARTICGFMHEIEEPIIAAWNSCCPFLKVETFDRAIREFKAHAYRSIMPVVETQEWYFDAAGDPISPTREAVMNTKMLPRVYRATHPFVIYERLDFLKDYQMWSLVSGDPHLFVVSEEEGLDIDTEFQFEVAEALYRVRTGAAENARPAGHVSSL